MRTTTTPWNQASCVRDRGADVRHPADGRDGRDVHAVGHTGMGEACSGGARGREPGIGMSDAVYNPLDCGRQGADELLLLLFSTRRQRREGSGNPFRTATLALNLADQSRCFRSYCSELHQGSDGVDRWKLVQRNATDGDDRILQSPDLPTPMVRSIAIGGIQSEFVRGLHREFDLVADLKDVQQQAKFFFIGPLTLVSAIFLSLPPSDPNRRANGQYRSNGLNPRRDDLLKRCCCAVHALSPISFRRAS